MSLGRTGEGGQVVRHLDCWTVDDQMSRKKSERLRPSLAQGERCETHGWRSERF